MRFNSYYVRCVFGSILSFLALTDHASACAFDDVITGRCPAEWQDVLPPPDAPHAVAARSNSWLPVKQFKEADGSIVLPICFFESQALGPNGLNVPIASMSESGWNKAVQMVVATAPEWQEITGKNPVTGATITSKIKFEFLAPNGEVRRCEETNGNAISIMFNKSGYHRSMVGAASLQAPGWSMTLGVDFFGNLTRYVILHEFGHALGFLHEMGHPDWNLCRDQIDYSKLHRTGMFGSGYTEEQELALLKGALADATTRYGQLAETGAWDPNSIMAYHITPDAFPKGASCEFPEPNGTISTGDREVFLQIYGR